MATSLAVSRAHKCNSKATGDSTERENLVGQVWNLRSGIP